MTPGREEYLQPFSRFVAAGFFLVLALLCLLVVAPAMPPTGDEPHYLVTARSLAVDHDLSLLNDYRDRHYRAFYPGEIAKRTAPSADRKRELPAVASGLPLLLAPFYAIASASFPGFLVPFLRLVMAALSAAALYNLLVLLQLRGAGLMQAVLLAAGAAVSSPWITYSMQIYPEIAAFLLIVLALRQWMEIEEHRYRAFFWLAVIPGALVWLHPKYLALGMVFTAFSVYFFHRALRVYKEAQLYPLLVSYAVVALAGIASYFAFLRIEYGGYSPNLMYAGWDRQLSFFELVRQEGFGRILVMFRMLFAFWLDQRFGLVPFAPAFAAFFPALVFSIRRAWKPALPVLSLFAAHFLILCWGAQMGGFAPPSRHMVVLLPLIFVIISDAALQWKSWQKAIVLLLQLAGWMVTLGLLTHYRLAFTDSTWHNRDGLSPFWTWLHVEQWIPSLTAASLNLILIVLWLAVVTLLGLLLYPRLPSGTAEPAEVP